MSVETGGGTGAPRTLAAPPPGATRCDASVPLAVELTPLGQPRGGDTARFAVVVDSRLDPDAVADLRIEYEFSPSLRVERDERPRRPARLALRGSSRVELWLRVPDQRRHVVRARVVAELRDGSVIGQTAVRWIDAGDEDPPEGYLGRLVTPDGAGIRVYRGATVPN